MLNRRAGIASVVLSLAGIAGAAAQIPEEVDGIPNYRRLSPALAAAGQPSSAALRQLKALGFKTVVNLRTEDEGAADEQEAVEALGLRYVWVPVTSASLSLADVKTVAAVLDDPAAAPVLVHCASSNRVGAVLGAIRLLEGDDPTEAEAAARAAGLTSDSMLEAMRRVGAEVAPTR